MMSYKTKTNISIGWYINIISVNEIAFYCKFAVTAAQNKRQNLKSVTGLLWGRVYVTIQHEDMISSFSVNTQTPPQSKRSNGHERRHVAEAGLGHASPPADWRVEMTEELETKG